MFSPQKCLLNTHRQTPLRQITLVAVKVEETHATEATVKWKVWNEEETAWRFQLVNFDLSSLDVYALWKRKNNVDVTVLNGSERNFYRDDNEIGLTIKRTDRPTVSSNSCVYDFISTVHIC